MQTLEMNTLIALYVSKCIEIVFHPEPIPTSAHTSGEANDHHAGCQEVGRCSTRDESQGMYITFACAKSVIHNSIWL